MLPPEHDSAEVRELLELSRQLLLAIDQQDWDTYSALCDEQLTAFEPEAFEHLVSGMDFHRFYFANGSGKNPRQSTISSPQIRLLGDVAIITYTRLVQQFLDGTARTTAFAETRIWHRHDGRWQHVHFHRSNVAGPAS